MVSDKEKKKGQKRRGFFQTGSVFSKLLLLAIVFMALPTLIAGLLITFSYQSSIHNFLINHEEEVVVDAGKEFSYELDDIRLEAFLTLIIVIILSFFGVALIARSLVRPIKKLIRGAEHIAKGNFDFQIEISEKDEIGQLTKRFNEMVESLEEKISLEEQKDTLEIQVNARTRELKELNEGLEKEVEKRTKELEKKIEEYEKINKLMVGRELKMIELKKELKRKEEKDKENKSEEE